MHKIAAIFMLRDRTMQRETAMEMKMLNKKLAK